MSTPYVCVEHGIVDRDLFGNNDQLSDLRRCGYLNIKFKLNDVENGGSVLLRLVRRMLTNADDLNKLLLPQKIITVKTELYSAIMGTFHV